MTLQQRLDALVAGIAADIKAAGAARGNLATLNTTTKASLVAAINEIKALVDAAAQSGGAAIDDGQATTASVYSSSKTVQVVTTQIAAIVGAAPVALDTLAEIAAELADQDSVAAGLVTAIANRVRFDGAQGLTAPQQAQARANIAALSTAEIGNPDTDFLAAYTAAKA